MRLYVCHGPSCAARVRPLWMALQQAVQRADVADRCELIVSGCLSRCDWGPNINVYPRLTKYAHVAPEDAARIVAEHVVAGEPVADLLFEERW